MQNEDISLGEYMRRLRRAANMSLLSLAQRIDMSYSHLSRIESDSTVPSAETVAKIAEAINGDLKLMLEKADCLPRSILDRILAQGEVAQSVSLKRSTPNPRTANSVPSGGRLGAIAQIARAAGMPEDEANEVCTAIHRLIQLSPSTRKAIVALIETIDERGDEPPS